MAQNVYLDSGAGFSTKHPIESTEKLGDLQHTVRVTVVAGRLQLQWWGFLLPRNGYSRDKKLEGKQTCVHTTQRYIFTYVLLH